MKKNENSKLQYNTSKMFTGYSTGNHRSDYRIDGSSDHQKEMQGTV